MLVQRAGEMMGSSERSGARRPDAMTFAKVGSLPAARSGSITRKVAPSIPTITTLRPVGGDRRTTRSSGVSHGLETKTAVAATMMMMTSTTVRTRRRILTS